MTPLYLFDGSPRYPKGGPPQATKVLWRAEDFHSDLGSKIELRWYIVLKETPKGFWIDFNFNKHFVLKGDGKRLAYETEKLALASLKRRKQLQIRYLRHKLDCAQTAFELCEKELAREA